MENNLEHSKAIVSNSYGISTEKDSITTELLSIRAGLSLISKQTDEVMNLEKEKRNDIERIREKKNEIYKFEKMIDEKKEMQPIYENNLKMYSKKLSWAKEYGELDDYNPGYAKKLFQLVL